MADLQVLDLPSDLRAALTPELLTDVASSLLRSLPASDFLEEFPRGEGVGSGASLPFDIGAHPSARTPAAIDYLDRVSGDWHWQGAPENRQQIPQLQGFGPADLKLLAEGESAVVLGSLRELRDKLVAKIKEEFHANSNTAPTFLPKHQKHKI